MPNFNVRYNLAPVARRLASRCWRDSCGFRPGWIRLGKSATRQEQADLPQLEGSRYPSLSDNPAIS